jgi:oxygen-independent coproporphyrinogen-3 oxidase
MCDFAFSPAEGQMRFGSAFAPLLAEAALIAQSDPASLHAAGDRYEIPEAARPFVRTVAARFDAYLQRGTARHSLAV